MIVTTADFYANFNEYLAKVNQEDIFITVDGKLVAQMSRPKENIVDSLRGLLKNAPNETSANSIREERLSKYENHV